MSQRIRQSDVEQQIRFLNLDMGRSIFTWENGKSNIGNYHLYAANGCYSLHVIANESGGVHSMYTGTLREVYIYIRGMSNGITIMKEEVHA